MNQFPTLPCLMCGDEQTACIEYSSIHEEAQVCGRCADIVANVYSMKHSGQYLTWPNQPYQPSNSRPRKNISSNTRKKVMERDSYRCVKCESFIDLQIDHIFPHSKGGSDEIENLQTLCAVCNRVKKDKVEDGL